MNEVRYFSDMNVKDDFSLSLENDFDYRYIDLEPDYEGEVKATFISSRFNQGNRKAILYIHGFIDYFFHPHLAAECIRQNYDFFALELRKYGHSILPHQHPNYCRKMEEYFEEVDWTLEYIRSAYNATQINLLGHSTGGLLCSYYLNVGEHKDWINSLMLNSPFLELNEPFPKKQLAPFVSWLMSSVAQYSNQEGALSSIYAESLHKDYHGEWDINVKWKPIKGFPAYFAWIKAITDVQGYLQKHSMITIPMLLMHSDKSFIPKEFSEATHKADTVLNVSQMAKRGLALGNKITRLEIKDGMHDLFLSPIPVRNEALDKMFEWLNLQ